MARLSRSHLVAPVALVISACAFHRTEVPWQLRTGAEEPVVDVDRADDTELLAEAEDPVEVFAGDAAYSSAGMEPPEPEEDWSEPELVPLSTLTQVALTDPEQNELGLVVDFLIDPERQALTGVLVAQVEGDRDRPAFVPFAGVVDHGDGQMILTGPATAELAADRKELAIAALFRGRELESFEGEIGDVDLGAEEEFRVFTLTDDKNHRHRVLFAPLSVTKTVPLEAGQKARLEALRTRDESGPLLVAAWIGIDDFELRLRDPRGRATWSRETPRGWGFEVLRERPVHLGGQAVGRVDELFVRFGDGRIEAVRIVADEGAQTVSLPLEALKSVEGVGLEVDPAAWAAALAAPAGTS